MIKKNISIHGSCVSRDIFNYSSGNLVTINNYIARQSILSSVSTPISCTYDDLDLNSKFQSDMVLCDLNKLLFNRLNENKSQLFILDCIDERLDLIKINNSILTCSDELLKSKFLNNINYNIIKKTSIEDNIIKESISRYIYEILKIYNEKSIVIHEIYYSNKFLDFDRNIKSFSSKIIESNTIYNNLLYKFYSHIKNILPNAPVLNISENYVADVNNTWGLSPFHFEDNYYKNAFNMIFKLY